MSVVTCSEDGGSRTAAAGGLPARRTPTGGSEKKTTRICSSQALQM
jgi:hypothetical protein